MRKISLNNPVILVHGIAARDKNLFWGRIPACLEALGIKVFFGNTDSWGPIESNANFLKKTVDEVLKECHCERVNIIAHSKGGLDARYLISSLNYADKVASLTTVSTPHRGSELVDYILKNQTVYKPIVRKIVKSVVHLYGDKSPDPYAILSELGTKSMVKFNANNPNRKNVYYCSCHSLMKRPWDDLTVFFSFNYLKKEVGANDGVVTLRSATWGENFRLIEGKKKAGISHAQIIDLKKKSISGVDISEEYVRMVSHLARRGL